MSFLSNNGNNDTIVFLPLEVSKVDLVPLELLDEILHVLWEFLGSQFLLEAVVLPGAVLVRVAVGKVRQRRLVLLPQSTIHRRAAGWISQTSGNPASLSRRHLEILWPQSERNRKIFEVRADENNEFVVFFCDAPWRPFTCGASQQLTCTRRNTKYTLFLSSSLPCFGYKI